jgi:acetolactate synthase regulatory subunit
MTDQAAADQSVPVCIYCGEVKAAAQLVLRNGKPRALCKACNVRRVKAWREANPDKLAEGRKRALVSERERYSVDREKRQQNLAKSRRYYEGHRDELTERQRARRHNHLDENRLRDAQQYRRLHAATLETATRHGHEWSGWELELVSDDSRSVKSLATQLGRTYQAVSIMRYKLKRGDPKIIERTGVAARRKPEGNA